MSTVQASYEVRTLYAWITQNNDTEYKFITEKELAAKNCLLDRLATIHKV